MTTNIYYHFVNFFVCFFRNREMLFAGRVLAPRVETAGLQAMTLTSVGGSFTNRDVTSFNIGSTDLYCFDNAMNRTLLPQASSPVLPPPNTSKWTERQAFALPPEQPSASSAHSCFAPVHYESGYAYPLIVWLHGHQSNEDELRQVMPMISVRNYLAIAPRGPRRVKGVREAFCWGDSADDIAEAGQRVQDCVAIAKERFNIHPDRIFVAGHSVGGTMAHRLGMAFPDLFAGAISLGGRVPRGSRLLRNINQARKLPLLLSVSPTAESYSTQQVMRDLRFLHCAGMSLSLRLYPDGDELTTIMFSDMNNWVMEQFCSTGVVAAG